MYDPVEDFLERKSAPSPPPQLREDLLRQTTGLLRRRRRWRRAGFLAALAACYLAGLVTMRLLPTTVGRESHVVVKEAPPPDQKKQPAPSPVVEVKKGAVALEWKALESKENQGELYRQAGNRYAQDNDWESALRCYGRSLDATSDEDLKISPDDDWLLMAIKNSRRKEKTHVKIGG